MLIGILQTGHAPDQMRPILGDYNTMFEELLSGKGFTFQTWNVAEMDFPNSVAAADGWLITGSRHGVYEDHPFIPPLEQFIQSAFVANVPVVGICFGHQIMAQAMGGKVEKSTKGWGVGRQAYLYGDEEITMNAWHQDQVIEKPALATTIASNGFCAHAGLLYGQRGFSVQAHPEYGDQVIQGLINLRGVGVVPDNRLAYAQSQMGQPNSSARIAQDIAEFFHLPREAAQ
ncbi:MAG: GMP synthase-like glutamine amidotransferase [Paracoccaceae bacterium]|mgnify:CR=1 FL=1|jgi:GMP synthase-like glutamine amidotransferase